MSTKEQLAPMDTSEQNAKTLKKKKARVEAPSATTNDPRKIENEEDDDEETMIARSRAFRKKPAAPVTATFTNSNPKNPRCPMFVGLVQQVKLFKNAHGERYSYTILVTAVEGDNSPLVLGRPTGAYTTCGTDVALWPVKKMDPFPDEGDKPKKKDGRMPAKDRIMVRDPKFFKPGAVVSISVQTTEKPYAQGTQVQFLNVEPTMTDDLRVFLDAKTPPNVIRNHLTPPEPVPPSKSLKNMFQQATMYPSLAKSICEVDCASVGGIQDLVSGSEESAGFKSMKEAQARSNARLGNQATSLTRIFGKPGLLASVELDSRREGLDGKRDTAKELADELASGIELPLVAQSMNLPVVLVCDGSGYNASDQGDDFRINQLVRRGRKSECTPSLPLQFVTHQVAAQPDINAAGTVANVPFTSTFVLDANIAAQGEQATHEADYDPSGCIQAKDQGVLIPTHAIKVGMASLGFACGVHVKEATTLFVLKYMGDLPQIHVLKPAPPRSSTSTAPLEPTFSESSIFDMPAVLENYGANVSQEFVEKYVAGGDYFRPHDDISNKDKTHQQAQTIIQPPEFATCGFTNLLERGNDIDFLKSAASDTKSTLSYRILPLGDTEFKIDPSMSMQDVDKVVLTTMCGSDKASPSRVRQFLVKNKALAFALLV